MGIHMPPPDWVLMWTGVALLSILLMLAGAFFVHLANVNRPRPRSHRYSDPQETQYIPRHDGRRTIRS